jgi:hypothetical protein
MPASRPAAIRAPSSSHWPTKLSFASVIVCALAGALPATTLVVLAALPAAWSTFAALREREALRLNPLVRHSAQLHLHFGLLLALGFLLDLL